MKELIGKRITGLLVNEDQSLLVFTTDHGDVAYETYGDCCSETWFADITGVQALIGGAVNSVEEVEMAEVQDGRSRQEYDSLYGVKLTTDKGHADIVYRNSSNGYYGGNINYLHGFMRPTGLALTPISEDWRA